ncbi:MAG: transposase [Sulfurospirillum sp.]
MRNSRYTKEFKDSTVQLVVNGNKSALQVARELDVNSKTLYNWIREYKKANNIKIDNRRTTQLPTSKETIETENRRLRLENKLLKLERDILKKATAYFAKETL